MKKVKLRFNSSSTTHFVEFDIFLLWLQIQMAEIKPIRMGKEYFRGNEKGKRGI